MGLISANMVPKGQQRTAALSLKLAQIQLMREVMKESPILLLDDVLSELDSNRKTYLLESIKDTQTIITCTGLDEFISKTSADPTDVSDKSRKKL